VITDSLSLSTSNASQAAPPSPSRRMLSWSPRGTRRLATSASSLEDSARRLSPPPGDAGEQEERDEEDGSLFAPKCLCLLSKYPYVNSSRAWLMQVCVWVRPRPIPAAASSTGLWSDACPPRQLYRLSLSPTPIPLERYICNFLLEVPAPVAGRVDIQYTMVDQVGSIGWPLLTHEHSSASVVAMASMGLRWHVGVDSVSAWRVCTQVISYPSPSRGVPHAWSGLSFEPLFEALSLDNIVQIFNCVLLEQQVLCRLFRPRSFAAWDPHVCVSVSVLPLRRCCCTARSCRCW
jgi:hypothetical protein